MTFHTQQARARQQDEKHNDDEDHEHSDDEYHNTNTPLLLLSQHNTTNMCMIAMTTIIRPNTTQQTRVQTRQ
jgi:hypothetical protein